MPLPTAICMGFGKANAASDPYDASQTELARRMKVSWSYITNVLHQDVNFSFRTAAKLANALRMDFFPELRPYPEDATAEPFTTSD